MKKIFVFAAVLIFLIQSAALADYKEGMSAYWRKDFTSAFKAFKAAAEFGDINAQFMLGKMYADGMGAIQNYTHAHKWLNLSASKGNNDAKELRDRIADHMTPAQLAEAQQLAMRWQPSEKKQESAPLETAAPTRAEIAEIQEILLKLGYNPGVPDGLVGEKTRSVIRKYQADTGIAVDGKPSKALLAQLKSVYASEQQQKAEIVQNKVAEIKAEGDQTEPLIKNCEAWHLKPSEKMRLTIGSLTKSGPSCGSTAGPGRIRFLRIAFQTEIMLRIHLGTLRRVFSMQKRIPACTRV